jgi:hypothetical protein
MFRTAIHPSFHEFALRNNDRAFAGVMPPRRVAISRCNGVIASRIVNDTRILCPSCSKPFSSNASSLPEIFVVASSHLLGPSLLSRIKNLGTVGGFFALLVGLTARLIIKHCV